jgi:hypothetical protein
MYGYESSTTLTTDRLHYKLQTRPLVREGAPIRRGKQLSGKERKKKNLVMGPKGMPATEDRPNDRRSQHQLNSRRIIYLCVYREPNANRQVVYPKLRVPSLSKFTFSEGLKRQIRQHPLAGWETPTRTDTGRLHVHRLQDTLGAPVDSCREDSCSFTWRTSGRLKRGRGRGLKAIAIAKTIAIMYFCVLC